MFASLDAIRWLPKTLMKRCSKINRWFVNALFALCLLVGIAGCTRSGAFPHSSGTQVDLTRNNYRVIKPNAIGTSSGFRLLGFIPLASPRYTAAMSDLYRKAGVSEGGTAQALANVTEEHSSLYLILFSIPKLTVRADVIEFTE